MSISKLTWKYANQLISEHTEEISSPDLLDNPVVSVCLPTYNHEKFIIEALDSVLMQDTNFSFEIVIGDDASTDGTSEIIDRYQREYPDKIKILRSTENLGKYTGSGRLNFLRNLNACRGKYIAMLEGDDYWTDSHKLEKQVSLLEGNKSYVGCYHPVNICVDNKATEQVSRVTCAHRDVGLGDMFLNNRCQTCSVIFKAELLLPYPSWMLNVHPGDWILFLHSTQYGLIACIPELMATYRKHAGGIWSSRVKAEQENDTAEMFDVFLDRVDFSLVGQHCHDICYMIRKRLECGIGCMKINRRAYRRLFSRYLVALLRSGDRIKNIKALLR